MLYEPALDWNHPAHGSCRAGMSQLQAHLERHFGAVFLGCYVDRSKTGGSSTSVHRDGRAIDPGFPDPVERDRAFRYLVDHATALSLSMVLVYRNGDHGGYRWRLPYRTGEAGYSPIASFSKRGTWMHIERLTAGADDPRTIADIVGNDPVPPRDIDLLGT